MLAWFPTNPSPPSTTMSTSLSPNQFNGSSSRFLTVPPYLVPVPPYLVPVPPYLVPVPPYLVPVPPYLVPVPPYLVPVPPYLVPVPPYPVPVPPYLVPVPPYLVPVPPYLVPVPPYLVPVPPYLVPMPPYLVPVPPYLVPVPPYLVPVASGVAFEGGEDERQDGGAVLSHEGHDVVVVPQEQRALRHLRECMSCGWCTAAGLQQCASVAVGWAHRDKGAPAGGQQWGRGGEQGGEAQQHCMYHVAQTGAIYVGGRWLAGWRTVGGQWKPSGMGSAASRAGEAFPCLHAAICPTPPPAPPLRHPPLATLSPSSLSHPLHIPPSSHSPPPLGLPILPHSLLLLNPSSPQSPPLNTLPISSPCGTAHSLCTAVMSVHVTA
ncbi:unnamed protein product [Closterium sp. NIES-53]